MSADPNNPNPQGGNPPAGNPPNNPVTYSPEQLHAAIEKARVEERIKLRGELDTANAATKPLNDKITELTTRIEQLNSENLALKNATTSGGQVDIKALVKELTDSMTSKFEAQSKTERDALSRQLTELSGKVKGYELDSLKSQLVKEVGGAEKVIMALIKGNTEEELRASVKSAHEAYMEIENRIKPPGYVDPNATANGQGNDGNNPANNAPPIVQPGGQGGAGGGQPANALANVKQLSPTEYKAQREKVQQEMRRRHAPAQR